MALSLGSLLGFAGTAVGTIAGGPAGGAAGGAIGGLAGGLVDDAMKPEELQDFSRPESTKDEGAPQGAGAPQQRIQTAVTPAVQQDPATFQGHVAPPPTGSNITLNNKALRTLVGF